MWGLRTLNNIKFIGFMEANSFAAIILIIIYLNIRKYSYKHDFEQKVYGYLIISNIVMLIVDIIRLYVDGRSGNIMYGLNMFFTIIMIISTPVLPMLWTIYIDYKVFLDKKRIKKNLKFILIPSIINLIFLFISLAGGIYGKDIFHIDSSNLYHRGELYKLMVFSSYIYMLYSLTILIKNREIVDEGQNKALILFAVPPFIGGILQSMIFGLKLTWLSMSLSMLIIFLYVQDNLLHVDVLTGLYNRRNLEKYLKINLRQTYKPKVIGGILLDINDFKHINDTYGHDEGDKALISVTKILKDGFDKDDFISRYAGDEFIVVCEVENVDQLKDKIDKLDITTEMFNKTAGAPYKISMSKGYDIFITDEDIEDVVFIKRIDSLMYKDKERYKANKLSRKNEQKIS